MQRIILHIDFDSFFASVEQQDNPLYRRRPLGVTATNGRTCIIAASREAKRLGIKSPSRTLDAKKICPQIIFVPAHFVRYFEVSKKFLAICSSFSPVVEMFSLDEAFMDVSLTAKLFGGVDGLIAQFKNRLRDEVGEYITASVGVSHNRLLAKLASGLKKPDGVCSITPENLLEVYRTCALTDICGIGFAIERRLNQLGVFNLIQLRSVPLASLVAEFGNVEGNFLYNVGLGSDESPVVPYTELDEVKSVGRQYCLPYNQYDKRKVLQNVYELCEEVAIKLRRIGRKAQTVGIYLGGDIALSGRKTYAQYFNTGKDIYEGCVSLLDMRSIEYVRRIGIWVAGLHTADTLPSPLLLQDQKYQTITGIIDKINEKFGDHTIRNGFLLYADKLTTVPNGYGTDRYDRQELAKYSDE